MNSGLTSGGTVEFSIMARLIIAGEKAGVLELDPERESTLGRDQHNTVVLDGNKVSRRHAVLAPSAGGFMLSDCGSSFGTFVNGNRIQAPVLLRPGDRLEIGSVTMTFDSGAAAPKAVKIEPAPERIQGIGMDMQFAETAILYTDEMMAMKRKIHESVLNKLNLPQIAASQIQDEELKARMLVALDTTLREVRHELPREIPLDLLRQTLIDELIGFGPISPMLRDPEVDEIMVNGPALVFVERKGMLYETGARFFDNRHMVTIIQRIVEPLGRHVDEASPMVDARLPDGSRVNAVIHPLALDGPSITVRKFKTRKLTTEDLISYGSMNPEMALFLEEAVRARQNILVAGGTGSGKTTLLNVLSLFIPVNERVVTIEDSAELKLKHRNMVRLESRPPNIEGKGRVTIRDLVINALRMRPDRIIVGECRGAEALDMLQAMNTGHDGSLTTVHANNARDALARLENMVMMAGFELPSAAIREQVASAIDLIVYQSRMIDGSRKITQISEITGREGDVVLMQDVFVYQQHGFSPEGRIMGQFSATGNIPRFVEDLSKRGNLRLDMSVFVPKV